MSEKEAKTIEEKQEETKEQNSVEGKKKKTHQERKKIKRQQRKEREEKGIKREKPVYVKNKFLIEHEQKMAEMQKKAEEEKRRAEAEEMIKQAQKEAEEKAELKKKQLADKTMTRDEESGLTYREIVYEAIAARTTEEVPQVSMNAILKYFNDYFTKGNDNVARSLIKKTAKLLVKEGILRDKRGAFTFDKKHRNLKPDVVPIRDLIERKEEEKPAEAEVEAEAQKEEEKKE